MTLGTIDGKDYFEMALWYEIKTPNAIGLHQVTSCSKKKLCDFYPTSSEKYSIYLQLYLLQ